jgi:two-component system sensor histidine kinase QseC
MAMEQNSLQRRILLLVLAMVSGIWLFAAVLIWRDASHELDELLDGHLAQAAALLVVQQTHADGDDDDDLADAPSLHKYAPKVAFQVYHEGQLVMRSQNAPLLPMAKAEPGFKSVHFPNGSDWRVFVTRGAEKDILVFVGEEVDSRNSILWAVLRGLLLPLLIALPALTLAVWWAVRRGLEPLRELSLQLGQRRASDVQPLALTPMPTEIQPVVQSLNALFERIGRMVAGERRFTADAAHELRTPIAAIRTQAQVAQGAGGDIAQREHALQATLAGCDRATRLVEQLLTLARLEATAPSPSTPALGPGNTNVSAVTRRIAAELVPTAQARRQTLELDAEQPCLIAADDLLTGVLVRNLLDNAMRYSPEGAMVQAEVRCDANQCTLTVQDSGPGMSREEMARLGERFFRVLGSEQPGSGLGWSIVRRIAGVSGANLRVSRSEKLGGLCIQVSWPAVLQS